jgi:hypothetical protein
MRSRPIVVALGCVRLAWGSFLVARPARAARLLGGEDVPRARAVLVILGVRHLVQGTSELWPHAGRHDLDPAIDGIHALTAAGLSALDHRWRRPAITDAAVATGFFAAGMLKRHVLDAGSS